MAYSPTIDVGTGVAIGVDLTFPYLDKDHVEVTVDYVPQTFAVDYSWLDDDTIILAPGPAVGARIEVRRNTPTEPLVTFTPGKIYDDNLNNSILQTLYRLEEDAAHVPRAFYLTGPAAPTPISNANTSVGHDAAFISDGDKLWELYYNGTYIRNVGADSAGSFFFVPCVGPLGTAADPPAATYDFGGLQIAAGEKEGDLFALDGSIRFRSGAEGNYVTIAAAHNAGDTLQGVILGMSFFLREVVEEGP